MNAPVSFADCAPTRRRGRRLGSFNPITGFHRFFFFFFFFFPFLRPASFDGGSTRESCDWTSQRPVIVAWIFFSLLFPFSPFFFSFLICEKPSVTEYSYALRIYIYGRKFLRNKKIELLFYIFLLSFLSTDRWNDSDGIWKNNNSIVIFAKKFVSSTRDLEKDLSSQKELGWGRNERRKTIGIFRNKYTRET